MSSKLRTPSTNIAGNRQQTVDYPDGDGKPIAETGFHVLQLLHALVVLEFWFRNAESVYVSGNLLFYYEEGNPRRRVAPDVFVVWGVSKEMRRNYKLWEEKQAPQVVIEITSKETQKEDIYENEELMREVRARRAAEAEVTRLKAEIEKLRSQPETN
jgi:Uma2 family endonuclease